MPITAYDASVTQFVRALTGLKAILRKAEQQVAEQGMSTSELFEARLGAAAPDMLTFASQVHWAAEGTKKTVEQLVGADAPSMSDDAKTFAELHERIDIAIAHLQTISPNALEASMTRELDFDNRRGIIHFTGERFLREFSLPHFYFHITSAYMILRQQGIKLTMGDFLGRFD